MMMLLLLLVHRVERCCALCVVLTGLFSCVADDDGRSVLRAVNHTLEHLHDIAGTWSRVLPTNACLKSVGRLRSRLS